MCRLLLLTILLGALSACGTRGGLYMPPTPKKAPPAPASVEASPASATPAEATNDLNTPK